MRHVRQAPAMVWRLTVMMLALGALGGVVQPAVAEHHFELGVCHAKADERQPFVYTIPAQAGWHLIPEDHSPNDFNVPGLHQDDRVATAMERDARLCEGQQVPVVFMFFQAGFCEEFVEPEIEVTTACGGPSFDFDGVALTFTIAIEDSLGTDEVVISGTIDDAQAQVEAYPPVGSRYIICQEVLEGISQVLVSGPPQTDGTLPENCLAIVHEDITESGVHQVFFNDVAEAAPTEPVDELPDTGAGAGAGPDLPFGDGTLIIVAAVLAIAGATVSLMNRRRSRGPVC